MSIDSPDKKFLIGLLVGVGLGFASALLLAPKSGSRLRSSILERARDIADRARSLGLGPNTWRDLETERAERTLRDQIERIRSAGY